jgi:hypothetical protein
MKKYDEKRRENMTPEKMVAILEKKKEKYAEDKDRVREVQKKYYTKNSSDIIQSKRERYAELSNEISPDNTFCKKCHVMKANTEFNINPKTKEKYKQCSSCVGKA